MQQLGDSNYPVPTTSSLNIPKDESRGITGQHITGLHSRNPIKTSRAEQAQTILAPSRSTGIPQDSGLNYGLLSRQALIDFHLERVRVDEKGNQVSRGHLRNQKCNANNFLDYLERKAARQKQYSQNEDEKTKSSEVMSLASAFGNQFNTNLAAYSVSLEGKAATSTINDRVSTAQSLRESVIIFVRIKNETLSFAQTLSQLIDDSPLEIAEIERKSGVSHQTLVSWMEGRIPLPGMIDQVSALEHVLIAPSCSLSSKLPDEYWGVQKGRRSCEDEWRAHQRLTCLSVYRLNKLTPRILEEWKEVVRSYVDPGWAKKTGLKKNSMWRVRFAANGSTANKNGPAKDECPTEEHYRDLLASFFGFLKLDSDNPDPWLRGLGIKQESLTIGMLGIHEYADQYIKFIRERTHNKLSNSSAKDFLNFCTALLRADTGYLWQHPAFGLKLPEPVPEAEWHGWCAKNREEITNLLKEIFGENKKNKNVKNVIKLCGIGRDPFANIRDVIEEREYPLSLLWDLADIMESLTPVLASRSKARLATHHRDLFFIKLMSANPLRCTNHAMMTFIPENWNEFFRACAEYRDTDGKCFIYVRAHKSSKMYMRPDGSFGLRFNPEDFKNEDGAAGVDEESLDKPYDVPIADDVIPALREYLFRQRPMLLQSVANAINKYRLKVGEAALSEGEEEAIRRCPYVLRPDVNCFNKLNEENKLKYKGTEMMSADSVSEIMLRRSRRFLKRGISGHAGRHLVASHMAKIYPDGIRRAAILLHITEATARKHYAWTSMADIIRPMHEDLMNHRRQWKNGKKVQHESAH